MSIRIDGTNTTANPGITGSDTDTGLQFGTNDVKILTNGTAKATVDSSGNLVLDGGSDVRIELGSNGTTETNDRNHIRGDGDNIKFNSCANGLHIFEQNGTEELRIQSGGGISFNGDTAAANALDDYEEGTWTPTAVNYSGTMSVNSASYVKIGQLCFVHAYVDFNNATDSSNLILDGLPFTAFGANNRYYVISAHTNGGTEELNLRAQGTTTEMRAVHLSSGDGDSKPSYTSLANKFIIFSGCFKTT